MVANNNVSVKGGCWSWRDNFWRNDLFFYQIEGYKMIDVCGRILLEILFRFRNDLSLFTNMDSVCTHALENYTLVIAVFSMKDTHIVHSNSVCV